MLDYNFVLHTLSVAVNQFFQLELCCGIPLILLWVLFGLLFFTIRLGFVNVAMFRHALKVMLGQDAESANNTGRGYISHYQAFATAISGTVGLGTISGVAIAVTLGGPGALFWMLFVGLIGMSCKFVEVFLGFKYRVISKDGTVGGGPFYYIKGALSEANFPRLGHYLALIYALLLVCAMLGGIAFQANQSVALAKGHFEFVDDYFEFFALGIALLIFAIISGSLKRIVRIISAVVPIMLKLHVLLCLFIIVAFIENLGDTIVMIFKGAFSREAGLGGMVAAFVVGVRRGVFSSEVAVGSASIAHAVTREVNPVRAGLVAMLEPCVDTMMVSFITGLALLIMGREMHGLGLVAVYDLFYGFSPVCAWLMSISAPLFGFSTILSYAYYCEVSWLYFISANVRTVIRVCITFVIFGSILATNVVDIASLSDSLFVLLTSINIVFMCWFSKMVAQGLRHYREEHKF